MNENIEIIDTTDIKVLSDFAYVDEPMDNIAHYYLGVTENYFVISSKDLNGKYSPDTFFERENYADLVKMIEDVYAGKLYETNQTALVKEKGKDHIIVSVMSAMPHTATRPIEQLFIKNVHAAQLNNRERDSFFVFASLETGRKLLAEMKRIAPQVER